MCTLHFCRYRNIESQGQAPQCILQYFCDFFFYYHVSFYPDLPVLHWLPVVITFQNNCGEQKFYMFTTHTHTDTHTNISTTQKICQPRRQNQRSSSYFKQRKIVLIKTGNLRSGQNFKYTLTVMSQHCFYIWISWKSIISYHPHLNISVTFLFS